MAKITWLVPGLIEGSGGHRTILQHANFLQRQGHETTIHLENPLGQSDATLRASIKRIFGFEFADVRGGWTRLEPADMVFATIWYSAQTVRDLRIDALQADLADLRVHLKAADDELAALRASRLVRLGLRAGRLLRTVGLGHHDPRLRDH